MTAHGPAPSGLPPQEPGTAITIGTFDGVHRGHFAVLNRLCEAARGPGLPTLLVTFDPHPLKIVKPETAPRLLTTPDEKKEILTLSGLDYAVFLPFTRSLSLYLPEEFIRDILIARFRAKLLVIGYDHGFGRGRSGDPETVESLGLKYGVEVEVVEPERVGNDPVSSTAIRRFLSEGDVEAAARGLNRPYSLTGVVVHGEGRGRSLGFATANLRVDSADKLLPREGIYAVRAATRLHLGSGLLHLGPRPTFQGSPPSIELHLLDFEEDLYGELVRVEFLKRLRDVRPFASAAELVEQMKRDREAAIAFFAGS